MNRSRIGHPEHSIIKALVAVAVIGIVAAAGWLIYQHTPISAATGQQTYTSPVGGFSFTYPSNWTVSESPAGVDDEVRIAPASAATSAANQFLMTFIVAGNPDVSDPPTAMANGTVQKLTSSVNVWVSTSASATRQAASAGRTVCPELELTNADQSHFSVALPNGKYLAVIAGYCQGQYSTASLTYQQQLAAADWQTAVAIIKSLQFN